MTIKTSFDEALYTALHNGSPIPPNKGVKKELKKLKSRVRELEAVLGRKTLDVEILKEAVKLGREKKLISRQPLVGLDDFE